MIDVVLAWLPKLILLENYHGCWGEYHNDLYKIFRTDFIKDRPSFKGAPVHIQQYPYFQNKEATFWHLISEGEEELNRTPDLRRCERIYWPKAIIEKAETDDVRVWESYRPWKGKMQQRITLCLADFSYVVVIVKSKNGFLLITAFHVEDAHRKKKLEKEYELFLKQKKEGSMV